MEETITTIRLLSSAFVAAGASAAASVLIVASQRWHGKHTFDHDLDGVQKFHTTAVPRIGGMAIVVAIFLTLIFCDYLVPGLLSHRHLVFAALLLVAGLPAFGAGIVEDMTKTVSVKVRLLASIASALLASWLLNATVDALDIWGFDMLLGWTPFALVVTAIVVAGGVNAVNIIDGFNGLAGSTVMVMLLALCAVGWRVGDTLAVELALLGLGAAVGFLLVNYPTGRLFMGDGGAYFLGFWVAEVAVLLLVRNAGVNAWQVLSICAYPIIEVLYSIYRRKIIRQSSPGAPDGLHLHTLVYRRVVSRMFPRSTNQPWKRNAAVAFVIVPWVAGAAFLSVIFGTSGTASMIIVLAQSVFYICVYRRLVRGRWSSRPAELSLIGDDANASLS
jgi:UDP-N-acetylmuramyl pentapeptide phosphotransferase/UDP-N-acetylglucosamine-1-phosphate transferase